ncbi:Pr6Pr family membrane protein [Streptomyces sp. NPDC060194]|uniref:Pr6Pr family membrane protein n=1 Tax=Streptomyces sp. NPDC060194 TaxID=3347069 RepID=UPI00365C47B5
MIAPIPKGPPGGSTPAAAVVPAVRRPLAACVHLLIAVAAVTGIVVEFVQGDPARVPIYFTVQSNALVAVVCAVEARRDLTGRPQVPAPLMGATVLFIAITGIVYHLLLADTAADFTMAADPSSAAWHSFANTLLHTVTPLATFLAWLLLTPPGGLRPRHAALWLLYPAAYLCFALVRGALLSPGTPARYPYPFLDVDAHGYAGVLTTALLLALAFSALALTLVGLDRVRPDLHPRRNRISPPGPGGLK